MATVNYSVPDDVKQAFNATFHDRNKSAIIAELMRRAVDEEEKRARRARAMDDLVARRDERPVVSEEEIRRTRDALGEWP